MMRTIWTISALLAGVSVTGLFGQTASFRSGIDVVSLNVTVTDPSNHYVTDLAQNDFTVFEDGVKQDVLYFTRTNLPITLALLLDTSSSMEEKMGIAQQAAIGFAHQLRGQDLAEIVDFDSRVEVIQGFTNSPAVLESAIRKTSAGGSTSLYNAIYIALKELKKVPVRVSTDIRRQAIVLLSDGEDTSSLVSFEEVQDVAKRSETAIYSVGLRSSEPPNSHGFKEAEFVMRQLAKETGGRAFFPSRVEELPAVYQQIADELSNQYMIAYSSKNMKRDGVWRRVAVRVGRPNTIARTKQGYYAPTGSER